MLTVALRRALEAQGGKVMTDARVERILVEGDKAVGVAAGGTAYQGRAVVAACHVLTTFQGLLGESEVPADLAHRLRSVNVGNGFGMTVRCAASALPDYGGGWPTEVHRGMQLLCPRRSSADAYADYVGGRPSESRPCWR